ncbi:M4 family metallopeptidase [Arundinibacter roseus]|uniref:M4 family peptidase n=1 Tax=Arundinibacter roseus TaxID=2070510 RepID=A0A4R4JZI3_9BACT|nr:M4 family metallopeptidase [Arundinibacter roseus]TDB60377.1 hypothetical protein EZE20_20810 [Arundinibacter roseus]
MKRTLFFLSCVLLLGLPTLSEAQLKVNRKSAPQQKTAEEKEQEELLQKYQQAMHPDTLIKQLDLQLSEFKKQGLATPELIQEFEKAREEIRKQFGGTRQPPRQEEVAESEPEPLEIAAAPTPAQPEFEVAFDTQSNPASEVPLSVRFYTEAAMNAAKFVKWMEKQHKVTLRVTDSLQTGDGPRYVHFQQEVDGYVVEGTRFTFTVQPKTGAFATGMAFTPFTKKNQLKLSEAQAFQKVQAVVSGGSALRLTKKTTTAFAEPIALASCQAEGLAWVQKDPGISRPEFWLCHRFYLMKSDEKIYINAETGEVFRRENTLLECLPTIQPEQHLPASGPGVPARVNTLFYGVQPIATLQKDTAFLLADPQTPRIAVFYTDTLQGVRQPFWDKSNSWANAALRETGSLDVHWAYRQVANYYYTRHNWMGTDNLASDIHIFYDPEYVGASFNPNDFTFKYGVISPTIIDNLAADKNWLGGGRSGWMKGSLGRSKPFASLDVCAHEFTHAVVESMGGMNRAGESGALNEAIADVMAAAAEAAIDPMGSNPWLIAEKLFIGTGIRNLATPKSSTIQAQPDTFEGKFWIENSGTCDSGNDRCGIHVNSGVIARWFYLICNGGMGTNDFNEKYSLKDGEQVSIDEAAKLVFQTIPLLHPASDFEHFSDMTLEVANNLFGKCSKKARAIEYAWYAVGVREDPPARCGDWTFDLVISMEGQSSTINFFVKDERMVMTTQSEDGPTKVYTSRHSALMTAVVRNEEGGYESHTLPKNILKYNLEKMDEMMPEMEKQAEEEFAQMRRSIAAEEDPAARAMKQKALNQSMAEYERMRAETLPEMRKNMEEGSKEVNISESEFFGANSRKSRRKAKREFDKQFVKGFGEVEGYKSKHYVMNEGMDWWSTHEIPLKFSDLSLLAPGFFGSGSGLPLDHYMRGFPLRFGQMLKITKIRNSAAANFEQLYSSSPVFR